MIVICTRLSWSFLVILLNELTDMISCICRSPSPWVPIFDQDQADLELTAMTKATSREALQPLQIKRNIPTDRILQRTLIEQAGLPEALTLIPVSEYRITITPPFLLGHILTTFYGCREALRQDFGNRSA